MVLSKDEQNLVTAYCLGIITLKQYLQTYRQLLDDEIIVENNVHLRSLPDANQGYSNEKSTTEESAKGFEKGNKD